MSVLPCPEREAPHSANGRPLHEAEQSVLSSMLRDPTRIGPIARILSADSYRESAHRVIHAAILRLYAARRPVDLVALADELRGNIKDVGNYSYLGELWDAAPTAANAEYYAHIVKDHADRRALGRAVEETLAEVRTGTGPVSELLAAHKERISGIRPSDEGAKSFTWKPTDATEFSKTDYRPRWLIRGALVRGQPAVVGGPRKTMKTSTLSDMVISMATGTRFLGHFDVPEPARVAFLSSESGPFTLQETLFRVCEARGVKLGDLMRNVLLQFNLPQFASAGDLAALRDGLRADGVDVLILDPAYLAMLAGQGAEGVRAENIYQMGPLLLGVARACLDVGTTPILVFHGRKGTAASLQPLDLDDLAYAGVAEFARQWLLLNRRERYEPGTGKHRLWLSIGGSMGHGGLWSVDIDEGVIGDDFSGRRWDVAVHTATETRKVERDEKQKAKAAHQREKDQQDDAAVLAGLDRIATDGEWAGWNQVQVQARLTDPRMARAAQRLKEAGVIEEGQTMATLGSGAKRQVKGIRRKPDG